MKKLLVPTIFSLFLFFLAIPLLVLVNAAGTGSISVITQMNDGSKIEGIEIELEGPNDYSSSKNTNSSGTAEFTNLEAGDYTAAINLLSGSNYELVSGETGTKTRTISDGGSDTVYFYLKEKTSTEDTEDEDDTEETASTSIPSKFYQSGSTSTNISNYISSQLAAINNFTLHIPDYSKIVFTETVDLSSSEAQTKLKSLDQYVFLDQKGEVAIASDLMPELDKAATVTFYDLKLVSLGDEYKPVIIKDEFEAEEDEVSDISMTGGDTITFNVSDFSSYSFRPTLKFDETEIVTDEKNYTLKGKVDDLESNISVFLNNERINEVIDIEEDGSFKIDLELDKGDNSVQITANGISEQSITDSISIELTSDGSQNAGSSITMILIGILVILAAGASGYVYYKKKYLPKKKAAMLKDTSGYDSRLLTSEEQAVFKVQDRIPNEKAQDEKQS